MTALFVGSLVVLVHANKLLLANQNNLLRADRCQRGTLPRQMALFCALLLVLIAVAMPTQSRAQGRASSEAPAVRPGTSEELAVGDLVFQVTSLRVQQPNPHGSSEATVSLQVRNTGASPVSLCLKWDSFRLVNDLGYSWGERNRYSNKVSGVCVSKGNTASTSYVVRPDDVLRMQILMKAGLSQGQTIGEVYDFAADFESYQDLGEGKLKLVERYPVSFVGMQRAGALQGAADDVKGLGRDATNALGKLFGH